jgi:RNA polymerase sigma factor (sigma-70 family)
MLPDEHYSAQRIADAADVALRAGNLDEAERLYGNAARLESAALRRIPQDKLRTIGILGVSAASLWHRAGNFDAAEEIARALLAQYPFGPSIRLQLEEVLSAAPVAIVAGGASNTYLRSGSLARVSMRGEQDLNAIIDQSLSERRKRRDHQALREKYGLLLNSVVIRKFRVPVDGADQLIDEVIDSYLGSQQRVENEKAWLVAALCNACRHYWRAHNRTHELIEDRNDTDSLTQRMAAELTILQALQYLEPQYREILYQHYFSGATAAEIADRLGSPQSDIESTIHQALKRVRAIYMSLVNKGAT